MKQVEKIVASNITKRFGEKIVLNDFSLAIEKNSVFCLMGPSGCGKTTLVRIMTGLEKADAGFVSGIDPERISFVFQEDRLISHLSALTNAILPLKNTDENKKRGMDALRMLGLQGEEKKRARNLSGGMARRVAIARAMLADADIVFMDEPFKGLDSENREKAIDFVKAYAKDKTLIVVTHSAFEAEKLGGRVFVMPDSQNNFEKMGENE